MHQCQRYFVLYELLVLSYSAVNRRCWSIDDGSVNPPIRQLLLWRLCCFLSVLRARWCFLHSFLEERVSRRLGEHELDSSTKLSVALLGFRVYVRLLLLPFCQTLLDRTQVFAARISIFCCGADTLCSLSGGCGADTLSGSTAVAGVAAGCPFFRSTWCNGVYCRSAGLRISNAVHSHRSLSAQTYFRFFPWKSFHANVF